VPLLFFKRMSTIIPTLQVPNPIRNDHGEFITKVSVFFVKKEILSPYTSYLIHPIMTYTSKFASEFCNG